ncbi:4'-phosphopantetheinyl transferase superfamily protein [Ursidibacter maritimus]|uniref:4'-phosphopantetheinyl transferase family protein n=1 Tax=Ursidibacter maritimus TaxID=1331689 RepID=UPI001C44A627|nr:4'-phosphopantetheinyl transferase superfamily protein [Ursidibacter maritimus]MBV6540969.1 4'-phosphopantetheinyl transferase superfamily protein [Ursidibacter maritimus]
MHKTDSFSILFAHNQEFIPNQFVNNEKWQENNLSHFSERLLNKWKSRKMADFLLYKAFQKHNLDLTLLNNIQKTDSGRPYIPNSEVDFNISHSGEWVAIMLSDHTIKRVVGIDIEHPQKTRRYNELLQYYASEQEITEIQNTQILPQIQPLISRFYLSWCLREAVLKSQGVGIIKLSEVQHSLSKQRITSAYCPKGQLCFYDQLPFYLAYFFEQPEFMLSLPPIYQWENGQLHLIENLNPIIYQVNHSLCQK